MRKIAILLIAMMAVFVAPVFATSQVNVTSCGDFVATSQVIYDLQNDITCSLSFGTIENYRLNLHGFTFTGNIAGGVNPNQASSVEILNGTVDGSIIFAEGTITNLYIHDLTTTGCIEATSGFNLLMGFKVENINAQINGNNDCSGAGNAVLSALGGFSTFTNITGACTAGTCYDIDPNQGVSGGTAIFQNVDLSNGFTASPPPVISSESITLINSTFASSDPSSYISTSHDVNWIIEEPATIRAVDQNNNPVNSVVTITGNVGGGSNAYPVYNPTSDVIAGLDNGFGVIPLTKNITTWKPVAGYQTIDTSTYNVTVKSRNQAQSKLITFHSPASATFVFNTDVPQTNWFASLINWLFGKPAYAQAQENFTLNFPTGNGSTNYITAASVSNDQANTLILLVPIGIAIAIVVFFLRRFELI